ncbi:hypothetical protein [Pectobacterium versatile]|uniref:hypothetical protein n=1 Tax=Pectobacterium versatile TaxID=2488639 RepID=UPI001F39DA99|nr:hypothetical protein [Pectobacterium versatile]
MYIFLLRIENETEFGICSAKQRVTVPKKTDEVEIGLFFRTQNEAIFGNCAAYDYPDRGAVNQERRIS